MDSIYYLKTYHGLIGALFISACYSKEKKNEHEHMNMIFRGIEHSNTCNPAFKKQQETQTKSLIRSLDWQSCLKCRNCKVPQGRNYVKVTPHFSLVEMSSEAGVLNCTFAHAHMTPCPKSFENSVLWYSLALLLLFSLVLASSLNSHDKYKYIF